MYAEALPPYEAAISMLYHYVSSYSTEQFHWCPSKFTLSYVSCKIIQTCHHFSSFSMLCHYSDHRLKFTSFACSDVHIKANFSTFQDLFLAFCLLITMGFGKLCHCYRSVQFCLFKNKNPNKSLRNQVWILRHQFISVHFKICKTGIVFKIVFSQSWMCDKL